MVDAFAEFVNKAKQEPPAHSLDQPVATWTEHELLDGEQVEAGVAILRTRGCYWSIREGCAMCGYFNDTVPGGVSTEALLAQWAQVIPHLTGKRYAKIYTSGSFLDPTEVPLDFAIQAMAEMHAAGVEKVLVESLPEFVHARHMDYGAAPALEVAIGLESATSLVLDKCVNKRMKWDGFMRSCANARDVGASVKAYVLLKPPFLNEAQAIDDAVSSVKQAASHVDKISINPVNVQRHTVVERLWKRGEWSAPWLWSVAEVLHRTADCDVRVYSDPTGGGTQRGAHNCGTCDQALLDGLTTHRLGGEIPVAVCDCRGRWEALLAQGEVRRDGAEPHGYRRGFRTGRGF
ncbi:MAG: archaeosine biosynthesis radical SAM protein RaSEA [Candidatus Thermoplasmatota archaeon]|nr:archaeosine biosynthesis radical SAM protein RaSEA [Candidatus Thermoplasmatota archaeon]